MVFSTSKTKRNSANGKKNVIRTMRCAPQQFLGRNEPVQSMIWEFGNVRTVEQRKQSFRSAFSDMQNLMRGHAEKSVLTHDQILFRVVRQANIIQCAGYKVTAVYGSVSIPMKRKGEQDESHFENYINYTIVYRKYKKNEKRSQTVHKISRTAPSASSSRLETSCIQLTNRMEAQNREIISRVMLSDIGSQEKIMADDGDYMMGRTRITIFYR
jgi:hypothetical protein